MWDFESAKSLTSSSIIKKFNQANTRLVTVGESEWNRGCGQRRFEPGSHGVKPRVSVRRTTMAKKKAAKKKATKKKAAKKK